MMQEGRASESYRELWGAEGNLRSTLDSEVSAPGKCDASDA